MCIIRCLEQAPRTAAPPLCWGPSGSIPADQNDACRAIARGGYVAESRASTGLVRLFLSRLCANTETAGGFLMHWNKQKDTGGSGYSSRQEIMFGAEWRFIESWL